MKTKIDNKIVIVARMQVIYRVMFEIGQKMGVQKSIMSIVEKGVVHNAWLEGIEFGFKTRDNVGLFSIKFKIDWEKHAILAETSDGRSFSVEEGRSMAEQVLSISFVIESIIEDARRAYPNSTLYSRFPLRREINRDGKERERVYRELGLSDVEAVRWNGGEFELEYIPVALQELGVTIRAARPK